MTPENYYLSLCPPVRKIGQAKYSVIFEPTEMSCSLVELYGGTVVSVEILNQFAVRSVCALVGWSPSEPHRYLPAAIRNLKPIVLTHKCELTSHITVPKGHMTVNITQGASPIVLIDVVKMLMARIT
jgi:hypothetical protein